MCVIDTEPYWIGSDGTVKEKKGGTNSDTHSTTPQHIHTHHTTNQQKETSHCSNGKTCRIDGRNVDPDSADTWNNVGNLLQDHKKDFDGAEKAAFQKALASDPTERCRCVVSFGNLLDDN